jgi:hypothetical protein
MRACFALAFVVATTMACGGGGGDDGGDDGGGTPDAGGGGELQPPAQGFQLISPDITLAAGEETTKCWYFATPNATSTAVTRWESQMTPGSHHMIVFFETQGSQPEGTISDDCSIIDAGGMGGAVWNYSAQTPYADQQLPTSVSPPVGMDVSPGQRGFIQMHYLNSSDQPLTAHVTLNVHTHADGAAFTPAAPYITFHNEIEIPAMSNATFGGRCPVPTDRDFYQLGTHAHKQATRMSVRDGDGAMIVDTDNWSEPEGQEWLDAPFHRFSSGTLNYSCDYYNPTMRTITTGDSAATDEMCMAVGYMFPATEPTLCVHAFGMDIIL